MRGDPWEPWQSIFCIAFVGLVFRPANPAHLKVRTTEYQCMIYLTRRCGNAVIIIKAYFCRDRSPNDPAARLENAPYFPLSLRGDPWEPWQSHKIVGWMKRSASTEYSSNDGTATPVRLLEVIDLR